MPRPVARRLSCKFCKNVKSGKRAGQIEVMAPLVNVPAPLAVKRPAIAVRLFDWSNPATPTHSHP
jgi:hypothetical protein